MNNPDVPALLLAWPFLLSTESASQFLSVASSTFISLMARLNVKPVDVGNDELRWLRSDLEKAVKRLPKVAQTMDADPSRSNVVLDKGTIDQIAANVAARSDLGGPSRLPELVSLREACAALGVGRSPIYRLINLDKIAVQKIGRRTLVPRTEIERIQVDGIELD